MKLFSLAVLLTAYFLVTEIKWLLSCCVILVLFCLSSTIAISVAVLIKVYTSPKSNCYPRLSWNIEEFQHRVMTELEQEELSNSWSNTNNKTTVESNITEITELIVQQYILKYLDVDDIAVKEIQKVAAKEVNYIVGNIKRRWKNINYVNFLTQTVVIQLTKHFESQQLYFANEERNEPFLTFRHLQDEASEEEHLRRLASLIIHHLLPEQYRKSNLSRILAQDILTRVLMLPLINQITDPHFLNLQCISNLKRVCTENQSCQDTEDTEEETLQSVLYLLKENIELAVREGPGRNSPDPDSLSQLTQLLQPKTGGQVKLDDFITENSGDIEMSLDSILESPSRRKYLTDFLDMQGSLPLLSMWEEIENLRCSEKFSIHKIGSKIFSTYLNKPAPVLVLDEAVMERLESFLIGDPRDRSPAVFYEIQWEIREQIRTKYFSDFLGSNFYEEMISDWRGQRSMISTKSSLCPYNPIINILKAKLRDIENKIDYKIQTQKASMASQEPDSKYLQTLSEEIQDLKTLRSALLLHIDQTESWTSNIGRWRSKVIDINLTQKDSPEVRLEVFIPAETPSNSYSDIKTLQGKLQPHCSWVEDLELPSHSKGFGKMAEKNDLEKLQNFFDAILSSDVLCGSELVYMFFTSSSEDSNLEAEDTKKNDTKFTKIRQIFTTDCRKAKDPLDDDLAEPLYALISEIYDLKGVFKWFRRSLISIAYISFGGTISRKLVDTAHWLVGESMVLHYLNFIKDIITEPSSLLPASDSTVQARNQVREEARQLWLSLVPDIMVRVVGPNTARQGTEKIFHSFQDQKLNKHLFYDLLEHFLVGFIPELGKPL